MNLKIIRELKLKKYVYQLSTTELIIGTANYTFGFIPRIYNNDLFELKQTSWLLKLINSFPILNLETFTPFKYYVNGNYSGRSKKVPFKPVFHFTINEDKYELCQHNKNYVSLMRNDIQVALYRKEDETVLEMNTYNIKYDENSNMEHSLLLIFCIFIDVTFYANSMNIAYLKYDKNYVIKNEYDERTLWDPND